MRTAKEELEDKEKSERQAGIYAPERQRELWKMKSV
jgi:hypothetical protein